MPWIAANLWLIPVMPLLAAAVLAVASRPHRKLAVWLSIGSMGISLVLSCLSFATTLVAPGQTGVRRVVRNFEWFELGDSAVQLGWVLDPLAAVMLVMVSLVGLVIFIYSVGYMANDDNFTRFFCFLSLFASGMLGVVIANSLLLLFICWELVGLTSYLLIGFWYYKPAAAAAAKKAFIVTRIGDLCLLIGMLWLYSNAGTLLFYNNGNGCIESAALSKLVSQITFGGMAVSSAIGLLIFCGAMGKSGQAPLHVWLPDAMEGPTPVSALIHAATMVAAGVFLVARVYPLLDADGQGIAGQSTTLTVVTWVGALTAVFAASIAVAQFDIKRILAYSTISQLGYMMMALGVGGYAAGIFHLITHAFFKALLFLGAGSVIHGCHHEQDIRRMGGLRRYMPMTFLAYAIGMMALAGVPVFFSGFWSKDEILHAALAWPVSRVPFYLGLIGVFLTAFYMTRQICCVFFGNHRTAASTMQPHDEKARATSKKARAGSVPMESPSVMTVPMSILAVGTILLGLFGTPAWPWFQSFLTGQDADLNLGRLFEGNALVLMLVSTMLTAAGLGAAWWFYGRKPVQTADDKDPLERIQPDVFALLLQKLHIDEIYESTVVFATRRGAELCRWLDRRILEGSVQMLARFALGLSWISRLVDEYVVNAGFDASCDKMQQSGGFISRFQDGDVQGYLRAVALGRVAIVLILAWGGVL